MAGLRKPKKYNWKDSNMALFGSDTEKEVKKSAAQTEPAWEGAGQTPGLQIWRIVKFKVTHWPKEQYGHFYNGDSYIILKTTKDESTCQQKTSGEEESANLKLHVHFWIGKHSSQDEYGTAAYKTVELDTLLDDRAVQHREVQGHESDLFKSYFDEIVIMEGGADTGFRHVTPEEYRPRLLHFCGMKKTVEVVERPLCKKYVDSGDVYILDLGRKLYQWNGCTSNKDERFKAMTFLSHLKVERSAESEVLEEDMLYPEHKFYQALTEEVPDDEDSDDEEGDDDTEKRLFKLSDASGKMAMTLVKTGNVSEEDFKPEDVFLLHHSSIGVFVWVGKGASPAEKKNGLGYAHNFLKKQKKCYIPISVIPQNCPSADMALAMTA